VIVWTIALNYHHKTVSHPKLLTTVSSYNIRGDVLAWIAAFFDHQSQQVIINNCLSNSVLIASGVPQGSVLGLQDSLLSGSSLLCNV